jgi:hypothetical protein
VQRALSEEQVQGVAEKIEAGVAEAEQAKQDEVEERRLRARQEREQAERQAVRQTEAEQAQKAAVERARRDEAEQKGAKLRQEREEADRQAKQEAAAGRARDEARRHVRDAAETVARAATAAQTSALRIAENAATGAQRIGADLRGAADSYLHAMQVMVPNPRELASLPNVAVGAMTEIRAAWLEWMSQTTRAGTQMSQELLRQAAEQQQRFAADAMQGWMEHNARVMQITMRVAQEGLRPFANRSAAGSDDREIDR